MGRSSTNSVGEYDDLSSPDPLATPLTDERSFIASSPSKRRVSTTKSAKKPTRASKDTVHQPLSPSRTVTEQTLSPWKIRVTVEAEPEEDLADKRKMQTVTRTIKIPLRGDSSPILSTANDNGPERRRRGSTSSSKGRRSVTPKGDAVGRRRRQSVTDLDIVVLGDDADEDEWGRKTKKSSPRKGRGTKSTNGTGASRANRSQVGKDNQDDQNVHDETINPEHEDEDELHSQSPELRQIDFNKVSVRSRSNSVKQKGNGNTDSESPVPSTEDLHLRKNVEGATGMRKVSANSTRSYPTPSPTPSEPDHVTTQNRPEDSEEDHAHAEGFDTIMESEGFTMIDLDSIPSVQQLRSSPTTEAQSRQQKQQDKPSNTPVPTPGLGSMHPTPGKPFPSYLYLAEGESDISSAVPSSPPIPSSHPRLAHQRQALTNLQLPSSASTSRNRYVTPLTYSSPRLPSPPRTAPVVDRSAPDSTKAVKAGEALRGAVEPETTVTYPQLDAMEPVPETHSNGSAGNSSAPAAIFKGFDSSTQRELRAGLRFGEELAKRQQPDTKDGRQPLVSQPQVWRGEHVLHRTPPGMQQQSVSTQRDFSSGQFGRRLSSLNPLRTVASEERKEASQPVSLGRAKQSIESPENRAEEKSRLPEVPFQDQDNLEQSSEIHDVTMNDDDEDDGDIWLAEAKHSSSSPRQEYDIEDLTPSQHQKAATDETSLMTNGEGDTSMSGLFWKMPQDSERQVRFGAGQLRETRRELRKSGASALSQRSPSGAFDIEKMLGTPKRIRDSLDQDQPVQTEAERQSSAPSAPLEREHSTPSVDSEDENSLTPQQRNVPIELGGGIVFEAQTPPRNVRQSLSPSRQRPPTPKSALKGSRKSFGGDSGAENTSETSDRPSRKVVWARRSSHMNEDWIESSRSMDTEESSALGSELGAEQEAELESETENKQARLDRSQLNREEDSVSTAQSCESEVEQVIQGAEGDSRPTSSGWFGWFRKDNEQPASHKNDSVVQPQFHENTPQSDGSNDNGQYEPGLESSQTHESNIWLPTSKQSPGTSQTNTLSDTVTSTTTKSKPKSSLPSYLLPPSYPSDPTRSLSTPLSTSGSFTNTHFRTLHILFAKSSRPRFHAPSIEQCRPDIRHLVVSKWKMYVDEDSAGLGGFEFKLGETEGRVLERFCREIEWGYLSDDVEKKKVVRLDDLFGSRGGSGGGEDEDEQCEMKGKGRGRGIWSGRARHGQAGVQWTWTCEDLARWLGKIVVGEVVREEEFGGRGRSQ